MTAKEHNKILGILFFVIGGFKMLGSVFVALFYGGMGLFAVNSSNKPDDQFLGTAFIIFGVIGSAVLLIFAVIDIITAWKIVKEKPNARIWGIVSSIISLPSIPFGTALGAYGLWFLFGDVGKQFYDTNKLNREMFQPPQPPPNNWA
jgi:hypothetical protein